MPGLVALAQLGTLEIHTWGCHTDKLEQPDLMVFDLDPDVGLAWDRVALGAFALRRRLHDAGLESFVKTTGGKGALHVVVPITRKIGWDDFKQFSQTMVESLERDEPALYTTNMAKARRKDKIFLDYLRNGRGATFIAPYSPRARPGAPVAVPIGWDELAHGVEPATFTMATVPQRLASLHEESLEADRSREAIDHGEHLARRGRQARMNRTEDPAVIEHRLLELVYTTDAPITSDRARVLRAVLGRGCRQGARQPRSQGSHPARGHRRRHVDLRVPQPPQDGAARRARPGPARGPRHRPARRLSHGTPRRPQRQPRGRRLPQRHRPRRRPALHRQRALGALVVRARHRRLTR